jgi:HSP20 family molecular chaperone IbpA
MIPLMLRSNDWWDHPNWESSYSPTSRLFDQHFALPIEDEFDAYQPMLPPMPPPRRTLARQFSRSMSRPRGAGLSEITNDPTQFQVKLDVAHFGPSEITVKAVEGNAIEITGNHEEKQDEHGYISRSFTRKYVLPKDVETHKITSSLTPEGMLTVTAPKRTVNALKGGEIVIPVAIEAAPSPMSPSGN